MNRYEKVAWFTLAVFIFSVIVYFIMFFSLRTKLGISISIRVSFSAFALMALSAFGPLMFKKKERDSRLINSEQETMTRRKTGWYRYVVFWVAYVIFFIGIWLWVKYMMHGALSDQVAVLIVFFYVGIIGMLAFILYLYLKKQKKSRLIADEQDITDVILFGPDMDERDLKIKRTARWSGFGIFWSCYVFGIIGTWIWLKFMGCRSISIDVDDLPFFVFGAIILIFVIDSITTIILYRQEK